jgi:hypothetical protein
MRAPSLSNYASQPHPQTRFFNHPHSTATLTGSKPVRRFRDVAQFRHKYALRCALKEKMQIPHFARIAQNYAVRVSDFVRNLLVAQRRPLHSIAKMGIDWLAYSARERQARQPEAKQSQAPAGMMLIQRSFS